MELLRMAYALRRECTHVPAWAMSARGTPLEIMHSRLTLTEVLLRLLETHHAIAIKRNTLSGNSGNQANSCTHVISMAFETHPVRRHTTESLRWCAPPGSYIRA